MARLHESGELVGDRYRVLHVIGRGGVGTTYAAKDEGTGRQVALKQLSLWHQNDWKVLELFEREAKVLAGLSHPNIPRYLHHFIGPRPRRGCADRSEAFARTKQRLHARARSRQTVGSAMTPMRLLVWFGLTLVCAACGGSSHETAAHTDAVSGCRDRFSPDAGYGWADDLSSPTSPFDGGTPPASSSALEQAVADCSAAGEIASACDAKAVMTRDAAICIAKSDGLSAGIAPLKAGIAFNVQKRRIAWIVQNTTKDDGQGTSSGNFVSLDAITGTVLAQGAWGGIP